MTKKIKQKLIFSMEIIDEKMTVNFTFEPSLAGEELFKKMSKNEKYIQHQAGKIMNYVMEAMKKDK